MDNFYQADRAIYLGWSLDQLNGNLLTYDKAKSDCAPYISNAEVGFTLATEPSAVAVPCGTAAKLTFSDEFAVTPIETPLNQDFLPEAILNRFKVDPQSQSYIPVRSARLFSWMRLASYPTVRRVYGHFRGSYSQGQNVTVTATNRYSTLDGTLRKRVIIEQFGSLGGRSLWGLIALISGVVLGVEAGISLVMAPSYFEE